MRTDAYSEQNTHEGSDSLSTGDDGAASAGKDSDDARRRCAGSRTAAPSAEDAGLPSAASGVGEVKVVPSAATKAASIGGEDEEMSTLR